MPNRANAEAPAVQKFWAETIVAGEERQIDFKRGRDIIVIRFKVPRKGSDVKKGICCVYFIKDNRHFLVMVSEKELDKMEDTLGTGRDRMPATNHAKTLCHGMKEAAKKMKWGEFKTVEACFGFWFDVDEEDGVVYKFKSCANYYNHGQATRTLAADEEQRLLAALDTVSAIPRDRQTDNRVSDGAPAMACDSKPKKPKATTVQQRKEEVTGKPEPPNRRKRTVMATEKKRPEDDPICNARLPKTGERCHKDRSGESRWCSGHWDLWHQKECPVWDPLFVATVPEVEDPCCLAWVKSTGLRCTNKHKKGSRWCGVHCKAWHGQDAPVWRPVPES